MRVRRYVYFALVSEQLSAAAIKAEVGLEPDEVGVRGSRLRIPARSSVAYLEGRLP